MSGSSWTELAWLRKLNIHIWAAWTLFRTYILYLHKTDDVRKFTKTLLEVGDALDQKTPPDKLRELRPLGLLLRIKYYSGIVLMILSLGDEARAGLSQNDLRRVIHFAELSLVCHERIASRLAILERARPKASNLRLRQRNCGTHANLHLMLAAVYTQLSTGDITDNFETAFEHYRAAARILEQDGSVVFSLAAASAWTKLAAAQLTYPIENRAHYAREATEALLKARELAAPCAASTESRPEIMQDLKAWRQLPFMTRLRHTVPYVTRISASKLKTSRSGIPDPLYAGTFMPSYIANIDRQLGRAYRELGELDKAIEHFRLAIKECPPEIEHLHAEVEVDKGYAMLESRIGDRRTNVHFAIEGFKDALAACTDEGSPKRLREKTYVLALIGDAKAYFGLHDLNAISAERYKTSLPLLINQLRVSARIARLLAMPQQLQEALYSLGRAYLLQGNPTRAYQALVLAVRVADRLQRSVRTPRLSRFFVSERAALDDLLIRLSCGYLSDSDKVKVAHGNKVKHVPADRILCFAERLRTIFLQTQLSALNLRPPGAADADVKDLFERRSSWHRAELRLLEQETSLGSDRTILTELRAQRNALESRYRSALDYVRERFNDHDYDPDTPMFSLRLSDLYSTIARYVVENQIALVEYHLTSCYLLVFVILPTRLGCYFVDIPTNELKDIERRWQTGYDSLLASRNSSGPSGNRCVGPIQWANGYLSQVLVRLKKAVELPANKIKSWEQDQGTRIQKIVIVPHRFLHLVPLHAVPLPDGSPWCDSVPIDYVPSTSVLHQLLRAQFQGAGRSSADSSGHPRKVVAISYASPSGPHPLLFEREEARAVAEANGGELLEGRTATPRRVKEAIREATYIHVSCHGVFDSQAPLETALELAPEDNPKEGEPQCARLTLGEILQSVRLSRAPLVVLSACETGLTKVEAKHEEYLGLPAGFLYAGAKTVISSLWPVADIGTWFLMRVFARELAGGTDPASALQRAQQELRSLSRECALQEIATLAASEPDASLGARLLEGAQQLPQSDLPFASPYWWAGFTVNGMG